jgi:UDP-N-acetylglucosamine 2-epimerase (non-hydrolysing)/GDP/UDP-N,N'-diacetylbacillosamine 2-epimerase (hydrolysing)
MEKRKICVVTGTRAEYGLLYWLMKEIEQDPDLELQIVATGMHLSPEFGMTFKVIEEDGFRIDAKVEMLLSSDTPVGIAKSIGLGVIGFADALERLKPDLMVILGDRFEILAAAQAAMVAKIPIAHIHGGERTEGLIDEAIRHAVTKMAHLHFVANEEYRRRVIQLGEHPNRVFNFGAPGIDNIVKLRLLSKEEFEEEIGFELGSLNFLVTYHPVTLEQTDPRESMKTLLCALDEFPDAKIIITKPNADTYGRGISQVIDHYGRQHPGRVYVSTSLGQIRYLSAIRHVDVVIGNSSSGIVEVPVFKKPTVNIGNRQKGRLAGDTVIHCPEKKEDIVHAIRKALSPEFQQTLRHARSLYGEGHTSEKIKRVLKEVNVSDLIAKPFYDR